jgi:DNA-binding IclR family transcriptional regulator
MAAALNLAKTTVHGLVSTLEINGFLKKDADTRKYRLGFALYELGSIQVSQLEINQQAVSSLQNLANKINRICRVGIWDRNSIIVTMTIQPQGHESTQRQFGPRLPGYCTALGKAILANMPPTDLQAYLDATELIAYTPRTIVDRQKLEDDLLQSKKHGYSISREEVLPHQMGLGAPVLTTGSQIAGAISARLDPEELDTEFMTTAAELLMRAARQISLEMGYQPMNMTYSFTQ